MWAANQDTQLTAVLVGSWILTVRSHKKHLALVNTEDF